MRRRSLREQYQIDTFNRSRQGREGQHAQADASRTRSSVARRGDRHDGPAVPVTADQSGVHQSPRAGLAPLREPDDPDCGTYDWEG